ncbi:MAG TPA: PAS domain S-box protein, partial [Candidatus Desulfofervidus auxilii]|nr:PAS domain S-box protein [Candidatus Desulfofervidus auxilii]
MEHKQIETKLRESEEKYRTLTESSLTGIFIYQDGKYVFVNDKFAEIHGYKPEELIGKDPLTLIHPDDRESLKQVFLKRQRGVVISQRYEIRRIRKDGKIIWCETMSTLIRYRGRTAIMGNIVDITERKQAEENLRESEEIFKSISASAQDGIIMIDNGGNILYWNKAAQRIFGYTEKEAIGKEMHIFLVPEKYHKAYRKGFSKFKKTGHGPVIGKTLELSAIRKDGVKFPIELSVSAMRIRGKWHSIGIVRDITQRKQAEEQIKVALKEKEVLLREIHHRVKNNMQIVSSLLRLQSRYTKDKQILDIFKASQSRIESMAFIHEKLYQSKDLTRIDFTDYVNTLVRNLFTTYGVSTARIK